MGGCRCTFRDCKKNSSNSPRMHFFRFPCKDPERCKKWALNADHVEFLKLTTSQLKNKAVCGDHFDLKCFMNFKKDSLTKFAVPTMARDRNGEIKIYQCNESELAELVYPMKEETNNINLPSEESMEESDCQIDSSTHETLDDFSEDLTLLSNRKSNHVKHKLLNSNIELNKTPILNHHLGKLSTIKDMETNKRSVGPPINVNRKRNHSESTSEQQPLLELSEYESLSPSPSSQTTSRHVDSIPPTKIEKTTSDDSNDFKQLYLKTISEHSKQIAQLKQMLATQTENAKREAANVESNALKSTSYTKVELFNGIKKYLNPRMVALLRIELFGSSEREYKIDEKQLAMDLYQQNKEVYEYMREEWRLRWPSKTQVAEWISISENDAEFSDDAS